MYADADVEEAAYFYTHFQWIGGKYFRPGTVYSDLPVPLWYRDHGGFAAFLEDYTGVAYSVHLARRALFVWQPPRVRRFLLWCRPEEKGGQHAAA